jgi:hypothetical protein
VHTQIALVGGVLADGVGRRRLLGRIQKTNVVGTEIHAGAAPYAALLVDKDYSVWTLVRGSLLEFVNRVVGPGELRLNLLHRAILQAYRLAAMVAQPGKERACDAWIGTFIQLLDTGAKDPKRYFGLGLARNRAGLAADASIQIDKKPPTMVHTARPGLHYPFNTKGRSRCEHSRARR